MEALAHAFAVAGPAWNTAVAKTGWHQVLVLMVHGAVAWLCLVRATIARRQGGSGHFWYGAASVLGLLGANAMVQADLFTTAFLRAMFQLQGWYGARRAVQYPALLVLAAALVVSARRYPLPAAERSAAHGLAALGLSGLLVLLGTRMVSAHGTDALLNVRAAGVSAARLLEFAALLLLAVGVLRDPDAPVHRPSAQPARWEPHV